jgi:CCR4-NOT transcription complex subunit 7/8
VHDFGEAIMMSGIVLNENVKWITFHSGYDYGYLLKLLTCSALPKEEEQFFEVLKLYFPCIYDIKYIMKSCESLKGGLQKVAETLNTTRIGPQHQAGSDSLLTAAVFFKMRQDFFENDMDDEKFMGILYGLGASGNGGGCKSIKLNNNTLLMIDSEPNNTRGDSNNENGNSDSK